MVGSSAVLVQAVFAPCRDDVTPGRPDPLGGGMTGVVRHTTPLHGGPAVRAGRRGTLCHHATASAMEISSPTPTDRRTFATMA